MLHTGSTRLRARRPGAQIHKAYQGEHFHKHLGLWVVDDCKGVEAVEGTAHLNAGVAKSFSFLGLLDPEGTGAFAADTTFMRYFGSAVSLVSKFARSALLLLSMNTRADSPCIREAFQAATPSPGYCTTDSFSRLNLQTH